MSERERDDATQLLLPLNDDHQLDSLDSDVDDFLLFTDDDLQQARPLWRRLDDRPALVPHRRLVSPPLPLSSTFLARSLRFCRSLEIDHAQTSRGVLAQTPLELARHLACQPRPSLRRLTVLLEK